MFRLYTDSNYQASTIQDTKRSAFRCVRKIAISNYKLRHMSILRSVRPKGATRLPVDGFHEIGICISRRSVKEIQVLLKRDKNNWYKT
jgi:hypothetical protein